MELTCNLTEKTFHNNEENRDIKYYVLEFKLIDDTTLEIPVKGDKARLLSLSANATKNHSYWPS